MELKELIRLADKAYDEDGLVMAYHEDPEGNHGDTLAKFIALELAGTFDAEANDLNQLNEATRVIGVACQQLNRVHGHLLESWTDRYVERGDDDA